MKESSLKKILFLGGNGFIGKNILNEYIQSIESGKIKLQFVVVGRSDKMSMESSENITYISLDFSDTDKLEDVFIQHSFTEVFHFISSSIPANSNLDIKKDIECNLLGTVGLLNLMAKYRVKKITYISSGGTVYGETKQGGAQEDDFNSPNSSYGIVKLTIEKYILLFHKLYGIEYIILRLSNPYGVFHESNANGFINIAIRKALKGEKVEIWGNGLNTKDYIYVKDFTTIFWQLYSKGIQNKTLNIGSGRLLDLITILETIKIFLPSLKWQYDDSKSFDTPNVEFSLKLLKKLLPIKYMDFRQSIEETIKWELESI